MQQIENRIKAKEKSLRKEDHNLTSGCVTEAGTSNEVVGHHDWTIHSTNGNWAPVAPIWGSEACACTLCGWMP